MRILIVCSGNTCRSPMAEIILREDLNRAGVTDVEVCSAGLVSTGGEAMSPNSAKVLALGGYSSGDDFRSSSIDTYSVSDFDIVLCMTHGQRVFLLQRFPEIQGKVRTLALLATGEALNISDPFGGPMETYFDTFEEIKKAVTQLVVELKEGKQKGVK